MRSLKTFLVIGLISIMLAGALSVFSAPSVMASPDNFGYEGEKLGLTYTLGNKIVGSGFACPEGGVADSITVWLQGWSSGEKVKCAIYKKSDATLVGSTQERSDGGDEGWFTFIFSDPKPSIEADNYALCVWSDSTMYTFYESAGSLCKYYQALTYDSWDDPFEGSTTGTALYMIYCTYTVPTAPNAPTDLLCEDDTNPTHITDTMPEFSAIGTNDDGLQMNYYALQVDDDSEFGSPIYNKTKTAITPFDNNTRCSDISYENSDLVRGTTYYWRIRFYIGELEGDWSTEPATFKINQLPTIPTNFTDLGMNLTDHSPTITWTKGTDGDGDTVTTYIFLGTTSTPTEVDASTTGETDDLGENASHSTYPLADGSTYYYRLRSWDGYEWSTNYTTADEFRMNTPPTLATNWTDLGMNLINHTPTVTWTKGTDADEDTVYTYWYCDTNELPTTEQGNTTGESGTLGAPLNGTIYYYRLRSWDGHEWSDYTTPDQFRMNTPPTTPTTLNLTLVERILTGVASGSTDDEGDGITYYYKFYNENHSTTRQDWSVANTYAIVANDDDDNIIVYAKAYDGYEYSEEKENSTIVTYFNTPPTAPTDYTDLGIDENNTPIIFWTEGTDADGDTVTTIIYLGDNAVPTEVDGSTTDETFTLGENASHSTYPLENGSTYYYRLRSWDGYEYSGYTMADEFRIATENIITLNPIDDSYVYQGAANINYGALNALYVISYVEDGGLKHRRTFLMFDLSSIPDDVEIYSATLRLNCLEIYNINPASYVELRQVWDDNWSEENITWLNQPTILGYANSAYTTEPVVGWMEWNILSYAAQVYQAAGDNYMSIALQCFSEYDDGVMRGSVYFSKEFDGYDPELVITYGAPAPPEWTNLIITSTTGGHTSPAEDNYLYEEGSSITLEAIADFSSEFSHWELYYPEYEYYDNDNIRKFSFALATETHCHAVFIEGVGPPSIVEAIPTILAIGVCIGCVAVGLGISKGNTTIAVLFLLLGMMVVSVFEIWPAWIFYISLITFVFVTIWKYTRRGPTGGEPNA